MAYYQSDSPEKEELYTLFKLFTNNKDLTQQLALISAFKNSRLSVHFCRIYCSFPYFFQVWKTSLQIFILYQEFHSGSSDGAVVRALASHQCGPLSTAGLGVISGLRLLLVLVLAPRGFSPGTPVFSSP